jgi:hypothetical protein
MPHGACGWSGAHGRSLTCFDGGSGSNGTIKNRSSSDTIRGATDASPYPHQVTLSGAFVRAS